MTPDFKQRLVSNSGLTSDEIHTILASPDIHYKRYFISQKNKRRQIEEPMPQLMALQSAILMELSSFPYHTASLARPGLGIKDNAAIHTGAKHLLRVDIKGCYQSITLEMCASAIKNFTVGHTDLLEILPVCFCEFNGKRILPTGAPTSPALCNIALTSIDYRVSSLLPQGYKYSRYLDDLVISTTSPIRDWSILPAVKNELLKEGLTPNYKKSIWTMLGNDKMIVTGVNIAKQNSAPREMKKKIRATLHQLANKQLDIDEVTMGYLSHIRDIDPYAHSALMTFYNRKKIEYVGANRVSPGT